MEEKKKLITKFFELCLLLLFFTFLILYISQYSEYNEYQLHKRTVLTAEQIKRFEEDIKNNKDVSIEDYYDRIVYDYNNKTSKFGLKVSESMGEYIRDGMEFIFNHLNKLIED